MTKSLTQIKSLARSYTDAAIQSLAGIAQNGESESARVAASVALLDRGSGKPTQPIADEVADAARTRQRLSGSHRLDEVARHG